MKKLMETTGAKYVQFLFLESFEIHLATKMYLDADMRQEDTFESEEND
jgi:hypothetical protein